MTEQAILARLDELALEMGRLRTQFKAALPGGKMSLLQTRLGDTAACFHLGAVDKVVGMARLKPIEDSPPALLGFLQRGSDFVPVLCLRRLLGFTPPTYTRASAIVLLTDGRDGPGRGVLVDEVEGLFDYGAESLEVADSALPQRKFLWGVLGGTRETLLLNHLALLGEPLAS